MGRQLNPQAFNDWVYDHIDDYSHPLEVYYGGAGSGKSYGGMQKILLKAMNRRSTKAEIIALLAKLRQRLPGLVLRTSLICGLPGEGEAEFEELCHFLKEAKIERAGIFQFSPEEGTPAAVMEHQVDADVAQRRVELLVDLQSRVMDQWNESRLGEVLEVLCEGFDTEMGCYAGRSYADSPDVDGKVFFTAAGLIPAGIFVNVRITGTSDGDLTGEIEE